MQIFTSRPVLRWLAPLALLVAVGGTTLVATNAQADRALPSRTAEELLVDLQQSRVDGLSGTVVERADLGLPALPMGQESEAGSALSSLISGTHTLRVLYSEPNKSRIAVFDDMGETDVITNGDDLWVWSSGDQSATHHKVSGMDGAPHPRDTGRTAKTPQEAAAEVIAALSPTTPVSTSTTVEVADRDAYELVLDPNHEGSLIEQVRVAIDGETRQPLRVRVFGADAKLVFEVGYTKVSFTRPADREFDFNPPEGTTVTEGKALAHEEPSDADKAEARERAEAARDQVTVVGTGWTTVLVSSVGTGNDNAQLKAFTTQLEEVKGDWGSGRLLSSTAFSAVLTDDGRLAVGAVTPELLYKALG